MGDKTLEVKLPQDLIDIIPQERITGDILRGHGPRRGNLEALLKYWRPIMRKPGGFRRCIVILANHPELYPLQRICAWLHHETTGKWPNEGNHHGGGGAGRLAGRVARRAIPGKRRRRRKKSADGGVEVSAWRLYRRLSREVGGISTRPINGDLNAVEFKAARFKQGMRSVPVPGSFDWDENYTEPVEEKVGLVTSHGRLGRSLQSIASFFIPGDMGKFRSPIRSMIWGSLTPGGGGAGGRGAGGGGLPSIGGSALRCPSGYANGGRFSDEKLTNCGGLVFDVPDKGPGAVTAADRSQLTRRFARGDDLPDVEREVIAKKPKGDPFAVVREAAMPGARTSSARRDSVVGDVVKFASKNKNTTRVVRRDGVVFEPRVSPDELVKMKDHDNMRDAVYVTSKIGRKSIAGDEIRLLTKGAKAVEYVFPEGSVRVERKGKIGPTLGARMRTRWAGISRDPDIAANPAKTIETFVQEFSENVSIKPKFKEIPKANQRVVVYTSTGKKRVVPRWVFSLYLSERAPRRAGNQKPFYLAPPQARYPRQKDEYWRPERGEYAALMMQHKALALRLDPLNGRKRNTSDIRISEVWGMDKDSLIDIKAARFSMSEDRFDIAVKVFGRRSIGGRSISRMARRMPKVVPYNPDARDGDNDGIVQEGTIWERPSGALFRGLARGARALMGSVQLVDADGNKIDYKPGDHDNSPLRRRRIAGRVAQGLEGVRAQQRGRIRERDRELGAEADMSEIDRRGELRRANRRRERLEREIGRLQGRPEERDRRADRQEERGQADLDRAEELRVRREARNDFDVERRELEERQRQEREELEERDPRRQRRQERRGERRERGARALERVRDAAEGRIRERDREEGAAVDREELDRGGARRARRAERRGERRERIAARLDRLREGQEGRIDERDREEGAPVEREPLYRPVDRVVERLRELFGVSTLKEQQDEDNANVEEQTGKPVAQVVDEVADVLIPEPMLPESDARHVQDLIDAVIAADQDSLPDDRSRRNVRNRFPDRGLPGRAFWRDDDYEPGGGRDADVERVVHAQRFGRYYDEDGNLNDRGRLINEQLRVEREAEGGADEVAAGRRRAHELSRLLLGEMNRNALEEFGPAERDEPYGPVPEFGEGRDWGSEAAEWTPQQQRAWLHRDKDAHEAGVLEGGGEVPQQRRAVERALFENLIDAHGDTVQFRLEEDAGLREMLAHDLSDWDLQDLDVALRRMVHDRHDERPGGTGVRRRIQEEIARRHDASDIPASLDLPPGENRDIGVVMAEAFPVRPADMSASDIERELLHIEEWKPDPLDRPFLLGRRWDELSEELDSLGYERGEALTRSPTPPEPEAASRVVGVPNRPGLEVDLAEDYPDRPDGLTDAALEAEIDEIRAAHAGLPSDRRPWLPSQRLIELEIELERRNQPARRRPLGREATMAKERIDDAMGWIPGEHRPNPDPARAVMTLLDASEGILDPVIDGIAGDGGNRIRQLAIFLADAPEGSVLGQHPRVEAVYNALRNRLARGRGGRDRRPDVEQLDIPDAITLPPDLPPNLRDEQRRANRVWQAAERVLGAGRLQEIVDQWPEVFDEHGRDGAGDRLLIPIVEALLLERGGVLRGGFGDVDQKNARRVAIEQLLFGDPDGTGSPWGGGIPQPVIDALGEEDNGITDLLRAIEAHMDAVERPDLLRERLQKVYDAYNEAHARLNEVGNIPLAEHARDAYNADPDNPGLLRERVKSQLYRRAVNATKGKLEAERAEVDEVMQRMSGGAQGVIPRANPADEPNVPTADQVFLQEVVDRALALRLDVVAGMWADTIADGRDGPKFGWEQFGIADVDAMWDNPSLSAPHRAALERMVEQAFRLGDERRFTSPDDPDVQFRVVRSNGDKPVAGITKSGNEISYSFSARIQYRRRGEFPDDPRHTPNPDGGWGGWIQSGSTSRSGTIKRDGTGTMRNGSQYVDDSPPSPEASVRGKRFATVYNYNAWMTIQATGGVKSVSTGPIRDGSVVWGLQGFHDENAASKMVRILRAAVTDFRANGPGGAFMHGVGARGSVDNPITTPEMADEVERLVGIADAGERVTVLMGHMVLNPNRDHPWMEIVTPNLDRDEAGGIRRFKWGAWWNDNAPTGSGTVPFEGQFAEAFARTRRELIGPDGPDGPGATPDITAVDPRLPELRAPGVGRRKAILQNVDEGGRPRLHVGDGVVPGGENITTQDLANAHLSGGGDIRAIPPEFIVGALDAHPGVQAEAAASAGQTRFERVVSAGITHSMIYHELDDAGNRTGHGYILKNADDTPGVQGNEIIGLQMAGLLGWAWGGHAKDGVNDVGQPYILMELAPNMAEVDHVLPYADVHFPGRPELRTLEMVDQRIDGVLFSYVLGNSDSHTGNNLVMMDENGVAVGVMPIDFGRIGPEWHNHVGQPDFRSWYRDDNPFGGEGPRGEGSSGANLPQHISRLITDGELTEEHLTERVTAMVDRLEEIERDHMANIIGDITVLTTGQGGADVWGVDQQAPSGINDMAGARVAMAEMEAEETKAHISGRIAWMRNNIDAIVSALMGG